MGEATDLSVSYHCRAAGEPARQMAERKKEVQQTEETKQLTDIPNPQLPTETPSYALRRRPHPGGGLL